MLLKNSKWYYTVQIHLYPPEYFIYKYLKYEKKHYKCQ